MIKFSIITVNYNNCAGLKKTIESVLSQTCKDYEYIIIDGGSTDGSKELIEQYSQYLTFWCSEPDNGIYNAMNKGVTHAHGEYVNFMNSGDAFYAEDTLEQVYKFIDGSKDIIYGNFSQCGRIAKWQINDLLVGFSRYTINHQSSFIKCQLLKDFPYDESLKIVSDWKFFWDMANLHNKTFQHIDVVVAEYEPFEGVAAKNKELINKERKDYLTSVMPESVFDFINDNADMLQHPIYDNIKFLYYAHPRVLSCLHYILKKLVAVSKKKRC